MLKSWKCLFVNNNLIYSFLPLYFCQGWVRCIEFCQLVNIEWTVWAQRPIHWEPGGQTSCPALHKGTANTFSLQKTLREKVSLTHCSMYKMLSRESKNFLTYLLHSCQHCDPEKLITESKFLQLESLQELMKVRSTFTDWVYTETIFFGVFLTVLLDYRFVHYVIFNVSRLSSRWPLMRKRMMKKMLLFV